MRSLQYRPDHAVGWIGPVTVEAIRDLIRAVGMVKYANRHR